MLETPRWQTSSTGRLRLTEATGGLFLMVFGGVFAAAGLGAIIHLLPRALREGDHEGVMVSSVIGLLFIGAGLGGVALGVCSLRAMRAQREAQRRHPDEPWLWKEAWAGRRIEGHAWASMVFLWCFGALWNLIAWPLTPKILEAVSSGERGALFGLIFPAVGLGLLAAAIHATLRARRFGKTVFELDTLPGVIGGELAGRVRFDRALPPGATLEVRLVCVHSERTGSGDSSSTTEHVLYEEKRETLAHSIARGAFGPELPLCFQVPYALPASRDADPRDAIHWRIELAAEVPGVDFATRFDVPLFETADSSPEIGEARTQVRELDEALAGAGPLRQSKVAVRPLAGGGVRLHFGPARNPGIAFALTAFALVWGGGLMIMTELDDVPRLVIILFALAEIGVVHGAINLWLSSTVVEATPAEVRVEWGAPGLTRTRAVPAEEIDGLEVDVGMQSGNRTDYRILARHGRRTLTCGSGIPERREALALRGLIARGLGRDPAGGPPRKT